jgi:chorismate mutase/prephenate dehydratase
MGTGFETGEPMPNSLPDIEAATAEDDWRTQAIPDLSKLRAELDRIDDAIHDLLIERSGVVEKVARSGKTAAFRPGREADIVRRLVAQHSGNLPPRTLFRMWRELLAGTTGMQTKVTVAVCETGAGAVLTSLAREHFGTATAMRVHSSPAQALNDVSSGVATIAVLPLPNDADSARDDWWATLANRTPRLFLIARLPFWAEGAPGAQALVVAATSPDASAADRSFLVVELDNDVSRDRLAQILTAAGLSLGLILLRRDAGNAVALVEVVGLLTDDDPRLAALGKTVRRPAVLGFYAEPIQGDTP